ncbi:MAG: TetR/AcrR family transcriptional regulator [Spirochaetales bacterium]|nr:TetR/AcrR family transcriptional regulator [Spirochaetales bacterium]
MRPEKNSEESKQRILDTAKKIFAEKGYTGARIDHIAKEAKVNKALIYYYFKSKEAILDELFSTFFKESTAMLLNFVNRGGFAENPEENKRKFEEEYLGYLAANRDVLKIIFMESLTGNSQDTPLFRLVDIGGNIPKEQQQGVPQPDETDAEKQELVVEFFTGIIPYISYLMLKEKWCGHFSMTEPELYQAFGIAMKETHEQYHKNREGKNH